MPAKLRTIDVYANPHHSLDADGVPQGAVAMPGTRNYIGAHIDHVKSEADDRTCFWFTGDKVTVPLTPEIATAVLEGSLIAADEAGARACGLTGFVDAKKQLDDEKAASLKRRQDAIGSDAKLGDVPAAATPLAGAPEPETTDKPKGRKVAPGVTLTTSSEV